MSRYVSYRDFDWLLLGFVLVICALGVLQIHSATEHTKFAGAHVNDVGVAITRRLFRRRMRRALSKIDAIVGGEVERPPRSQAQPLCAT